MLSHWEYEPTMTSYAAHPFGAGPGDSIRAVHFTQSTHNARVAALGSAFALGWTLGSTWRLTLGLDTSDGESRKDNGSLHHEFCIKERLR